MARRLLVGAAGKAIPKAKGFRAVKMKRKVQRYFGGGRYGKPARLNRSWKRSFDLGIDRLVGGLTRKAPVSRTKYGHKITGVSPRGRKAIRIGEQLPATYKKRRRVVGGTLVGGSVAYAGGAVAVSAARRKKKARTVTARRRRRQPIK